MRRRKQRQPGIGVILSDRRVTTVILVVFLVMAGAGLVLPILPLYARSSFGVGYGAVGVLVSAYGLARLVFDLVAGPIVDRFGERVTAVGGLAVIGLGSALTGLAPSFGMAMASWAAAGVGSASGLVADRFGLAGPLLLNAVVVALAAVLWLALIPAVRQPEQKQPSPAPPPD